MVKQKLSAAPATAKAEDSSEPTKKPRGVAKKQRQQLVEAKPLAEKKKQKAKPQKKKKPDPSAPVSPEEAARREKQRAAQQAAMAARQQGEAYTASKRKRAPKDRRKFDERDSQRKKSDNKQRRERQKETKKQRAQAPDVVVIPIFWKGEAGQRASVLSVCVDVEKLLSDAGKKVVMDGGHKFTPGQKFAHWEHRGVKLRVEVGPREAEKGCCTLARTFEPGSVARRETGVPVEPEAVLPRLQMLEDLQDDEDDAEAEGEGEEEDVAPALGGKAPTSSGDALDDDEVTENQESGAERRRDKAFNAKKGGSSTKPKKPAETSGSRTAIKKVKVVSF